MSDADGRVVIDTELGTKNFEAQIRSVERKLNDMIADYEAMSKDKGFNEKSNEAIELRKNIEKLSNQLQNLYQKQQDLNETKSFEGIGNSISGIIKKLGKWTIALFGIRSAYSFIRQAMSTLSQYNDQMATDVEYIRFALATTLQPVIEAIIKLVYQLLGLINSIAKAWFGVDLFANASVDAFNRNKKAIAGANKNAKELQKTLTGFDKLNILQEDGSTAIGGGGGGIVSPSIDLSQIGDVDLGGINKLLDRIKELFNSGFTKIVQNMIKVLRDLGFSDEFISIFAQAFDGIRNMVIGLFDFIIGIAKIIVGFLSGDTDLVKQGVEQAIKGMYTTILGFFEFIINTLRMLPQLILELLRMIALFIYDKLIRPVGDWFRELPDKITTAISNGVRNAVEWFNRIPEKLNEVKNRVVEIFRNMGTAVSSSIGDGFKNVINAVLSRAEIILNKPISTINSLVDKINGIPGINLGRLSTIKLPRMQKGGILNMPGRGVDYYAANIAERGPEAVIPMTNEQSLETIGRTIARYATFNADITLEIENRVLARIQKELNADRQFARNGG